MKIIIAAGGTGGHLYPALALAKYIEEQVKDVEFLFVGTVDRLESKVVPQMGYKYIGLHVKGLVGNPLKKAYAGVIFVKSIFTAKKIIKKFKPDIVLGFGGYPSASVVKAASSLKIKTLIHEQNSIVGLTNRILLKEVDKVVCCYQKAYEVLPKEKTYLYGNPRASVVVNSRTTDIFSKYHLDRNKKLVVIVMGSLGSKSINDAMIEALHAFQNKEYTILYVTGKPYYQEVLEQLGKVTNTIKVVPYIDDMPSVLANTSLVVSRAGASTLAEITALGVPAILIPSPYVAANHQEYNASELVNKEAAMMILEKDLQANDLVTKVDTILTNPMLIESMKKNALSLGKPNACKDMYQLIQEMLGDKL